MSTNHRYTIDDVLDFLTAPNGDWDDDLDAWVNVKVDGSTAVMTFSPTAGDDRKMPHADLRERFRVTVERIEEAPPASEVRLYGASDDLIEARGAVDEEFGAVYDGATTMIVHVLTESGESEVRLRFDGTGEFWTVTEETASGLVTIVSARGEDEPNDEDGCPGYSQKAIVRGGFAVEVGESR